MSLTLYVQLVFNQHFLKKIMIHRTGSKGDYIFKDYQDDIEVTSIMFEMKNESDTTTTKKEE